MPLSYEPEPVRVPTPDVRVTREERPRLARQALLILGRLQQGPATNGELSQIALRYSARVFELKAAGHDIRITKRDHVTGLTVYALVVGEGRR